MQKASELKIIKSKLMKIKLRLPEGVDVPSDEPVVVKFGRPIDGLNLLPRQWLNTLSALLSKDLQA